MRALPDVLGLFSVSVGSFFDKVGRKATSKPMVTNIPLTKAHLIVYGSVSIGELSMKIEKGLMVPSGYGKYVRSDSIVGL